MDVRRAVSRVVLVVVVAGASAAVSGCRARREPLYGHATVVSDALLVSVTDAHVSGERVVVKTWLQNQTGRPVIIHRDALSLRLADGRVLPGPRGGRASRPLVIPPGKGRAVRLGFRTDGETDVHSARLLLSGVFVQGESKAREVGEVALSSNRAPMGEPAKKRVPAANQEPGEGDDEGDAEEGTIDWEGDDEEGAEPAAPPSEEWEIGGGKS
jgi:hypothetical protein